MRLDTNEQEIIITTIKEVFGYAKILLFGSRIDNSKKGGDIDLFVIPQENSDLFEKKIKVLAKLERILHKPVDLVVHKNFERAIEREILKAYIRLA